MGNIALESDIIVITDSKVTIQFEILQLWCGDWRYFFTYVLSKFYKDDYIQRVSLHELQWFLQYLSSLNC